MSNKKRILFVDDDVNVLNGLRRMLRGMRNDWKMEFVTRSQDAMTVMKNTQYDIVVSDLRMPGLDGVQLLERVRDKYPDTIRFMLSGYSDKSLRGRATRCVHQFVPKPYDAELLKDLISRAFALRERIRSKKASKVLSALRSLPVMPTIYREIIDTLNTPGCSSRQIGKIIAEDIGMSVKVLQIVNSAFYGSGGRIVDPVHAVVFLGLKTMEALITTHGIFSELSQDKVMEFSVESLQAHCFRVGALTKSICRSEGINDEDLDVATMAGILHDAGKIVLISKFPDELSQAVQKSRTQQIPLYQVESNILNITHAELGGCLLDLWGFPNNIIEAVTFHHEPWQCLSNGFSITAAVYAANVIDHRLCCGLGDGGSEEADIGYLQHIGVKDRWKQWQKMHLPIEIQEYEYVG